MILAGKNDEVDDSTTTTTNHPNSYNHYSIVQSTSYERNESISTLIIHNFNIKHHAGRYKCQYKGLVKTVKLNPFSKYGNIQFFIYNFKFRQL